MRVPLLRKILSCLMVMLPAALFAADSPTAMLYTNGTTWVNGSSIPRSSAIFSGDLIETKTDSVANINAPGSSVRILSDSLVQFEGNDVKLEHGVVTVSTAKAMATKAGDVKVSPARAGGWTEFEVKDVDGRVRIAAEKGDLTITDDTGSTTLPQGQETTRDDSGSHKNRKKKGAGAVPAAGGTLLDTPVAIGIGAAAIGGVTTWVLIKNDDPVSPSKP
jgi:hypothetical protein